MTKYIAYGTETDGPYVVPVSDDQADAYAANVGGHVGDSFDSALDAWRDRDAGEPVFVAEDAAAPTADHEGSELGTGDPKPQATENGPEIGTQTPPESSPAVDQA